MIDLSPLWRTLEQGPACAGVRDHWHAVLGEALSFVEPYLVPENRYAETYPCNLGRLCSRRVIVHGEDDIVAICERHAADCPPLDLRLEDLVVLALSVEKLAARLGNALGLDGPAGDRLDGVRGAWSLGSRLQPTGNRSPAFLVLPDREEGFGAATAQLVARHPMTPPLILVPTGEMMTTRERTWLAERSVDLRACVDAFVGDNAGHIVGKRPPTIEAQGDAPTPSTAPRCLALCFTHERREPILIESETDLDARRASVSTVDHFVDAVVHSPCATTRKDGTTSEDTLTQGEVTMLVALLARYAHRRDPVRPESLRVPNLETADSRKKAFSEMRRKVDCNTTSRRQYRLFKSRASFSGGPREHFIDPDAASFCFLIRPEHYEAVRDNAVK